MRSILVSLAVTILPALLSALPARAADDNYPSRTVRWIVPYPPGGTTDILARIMGQWISERVGQQVLIDNRPGAGNNIGTDIAAKASPDGYTLIIVNPSFAINASLFRTLPYDTPAPSDLDRLRRGDLTTSARLKNPQVPMEIDQIVLKAMRADVTTRYQSAEALLDGALGELRNGRLAVEGELLDALAHLVAGTEGNFALMAGNVTQRHLFDKTDIQAPVDGEVHQVEHFVVVTAFLDHAVELDSAEAGLARRIDAFNVKCRIGFSVTQTLGFLEYHIKI